MERNKIYLGHNIETIRQWPDESVNCIVTSPPYYGLRDYETEKQIWDGDPECDHEWEVKYKKGSSGGFSEKNNIKGKEGFQHFKNTKHAFCTKCQAFKGELGQEPTPELYIKHLCDLFEECKRVLSKDGSCWVNLADSHAGSGGKGNQYKNKKKGVVSFYKQPKISVRAKSLIGIPAQFEEEMKRRGWILRNTIIWFKEGCMPSSARDRFTIDFEYFFFFVKNNKSLYYVNEKTLQVQRKKPKGIHGIEGVDWGFVFRRGKLRKQNYWRSFDSYFNQQFEPLKESTKERAKHKWCASNSKSSKHQQFNGLNRNEPFAKALNPMGRNKRTMWKIDGDKVVIDRAYFEYLQMFEKYKGQIPQERAKGCLWTINTANEKEAHFAVFPEELVETPIDACCPPKICTKCGLPQIRIAVREHPGTSENGGKHKNSIVNGTIPTKTSEIKGLKWVKCECNAPTKPGVVFDPFAGTATTLRVASKKAMDWVGCEVSEEYYQIALKKMKPFTGKRLTDFMEK